MLPPPFPSLCAPGDAHGTTSLSSSNATSILSSGRSGDTSTLIETNSLRGLRMDVAVDMESHPSSAAAFVEGGIQCACDDGCSICLEDFCDSNPSAVTNCKHEFHLQCILEWVQKSSQCPMCWQSISMKDPASQELLEAVVRERSIRVNRPHNTTTSHHPALGDFELQHLQVGQDDAGLEERIIQHLAAAAAMGRTRRIARWEGQRSRSGAQSRPQFLVFSTHTNISSGGSVSAPSARRGVENEPASAIISVVPSFPPAAAEEEPSHQVLHTTPGQADQVDTLRYGNSVTAANRPRLSNSRTFAGQSTPVGHNTAGPSDFHAFSENLKSRLNAVSMRYRESFTRSARGWKEKLFSRSTSMTDPDSEVRREVNAGTSTVSCMIECLDTREVTGALGSSIPHSVQSHSVIESRNERFMEWHTNTLPNESNTSASLAGNSRPI